MAVLVVPVMVAIVVAGGRTLHQDEPRHHRGPDRPGYRGRARGAGDVGHRRDPARQASRASPPVHSRAIDPEAVAPPALPAEGLERVEPREPLSELALAVPPKPPKAPDDWDGTKLFQPVASAAGLIEAKGYSVAVSGIDIVRQDETCSDDGKSWPCGVRARTAFRAFLRGRAVACTVPPEGDRDADRRRMPDRQAGCRPMAGRKRLGARRGRRPLYRSRRQGARGEEGHFRRRRPILAACPAMPAAPHRGASATDRSIPGRDVPPADGDYAKPADQPAPAQ